MGFWQRQLTGPSDPAKDAGWRAPAKRKGFFTDTSICIGCKACEVACKEWNRVPTRSPDGGAGTLAATSYDNSGHLGANTWRHVAFIEQGGSEVADARASGGRVSLGMPSVGPPGSAPDASGQPATFRWLMSSDVCKHCTHAGCLDVCPTGSLFRTEFGTVVVQADICNGCGYCVPACPFGVIERREKGTVSIESTTPAAPEGVAQKCTLCYDRLGVGQEPACAHTCPTESIRFGDHDDMVAAARERLAVLHAQGRTEARLYGANPDDGVGGSGAVFLLLDEPETYGLPPDPVVATSRLPQMYRMALTAAGAMAGVVAVAFSGHAKGGAS